MDNFLYIQYIKFFTYLNLNKILIKQKKRGGEYPPLNTATTQSSSSVYFLDSHHL